MEEDCTCPPAAVGVPERSPGSASAGAERGPLHPGSAQGGRWERLWLALATGMGFSMLEAAQLAHGAQQAFQRVRNALAALHVDLRHRAARAARSLFSALLRVHGWELMPTAGAYRFKAARLDGAQSLHSDGPWWQVLRQARSSALTPAQAQALVLGTSERIAQAEAEAEAATLRAFQRRQALSRLCARLRFYRETVLSEWKRRVRAERALEQSQALLDSECHERDFATIEVGEASRRAMEAETRLGTVGAELEALGGELEEARAC